MSTRGPPDAILGHLGAKGCRNNRPNAKGGSSGQKIDSGATVGGFWTLTPGSLAALWPGGPWAGGPLSMGACGPGAGVALERLWWPGLWRPTGPRDQFYATPNMKNWAR